MKLDDDVKKMTPRQLRQELMRWRHAARKELACTGNRRCWITLIKELPEGRELDPLSLPKEEFLGNCEHYYDRNQK
jgi:hypothetical protein